MPLLFALGTAVIGNADVATFSAFGAFAMLLLVDFSGPLRDRVQAQIALAITGAVFVCLGTLASHPVWLAAVAMAIIAFAVLFVGTVSSVLASASTALLLAFILPVTIPATVDSIGPRLLGWGIASVAGIVAITVLWPAPAREPLRRPAAEACRALAARLRADAAYMLGDGEPDVAADRERAIADADAAVSALHAGFLATPYRPTGLSTSARTVVRLVDELNWLNAVIAQSHSLQPSATPAHRAACKVKRAAASVLEQGATLLSQIGGDPAELEAAVARLKVARTEIETTAMTQRAAHAEMAGKDVAGAFISALDPGFRAQELSHAVTQVAGNIALTAESERRTWMQRVLGRQPGNLLGPFSAAVQRASGYLEWHSVWLRNSIRGAVALGLAVLLADLTGVEHSFWVVLGTLSVLRSNALSTGQTVLRGVLGTVVGVVIGAALIFVIGENPIVLWVLLPIAILVAGVAPSAISFAAGQAGFTVTLVLLFNIIAPTGWTVGLLRIEDIALGCVVSLFVGLLFWPRGASAALRLSLAEAYDDGVQYLTASVAYGLGHCDETAPFGPEPITQSLRAAASSRRLDDTFRTYLAERGAKRRPLAQVTASVTGVAGLRLASDAIVDIWRGQRRVEGDRGAARRALNESADRLNDWYRELGRQLVDRGDPPRPLPQDPVVERRLADAVARDLSDDSGNATATAVRIIWTGDYLDVVRRQQPVIVGSADELGDEAAKAART
ncbi:MAG TPA: FUSC family protein [Humibacter sp.]|nr:FUSC family protein [Humibacter sp.]